MAEEKTHKPIGRVSGKIYFTGDLVFDNSFVTVASGSGDTFTDSRVYRDTRDNLIIPATSFAGVLRDQVQTLFNLKGTELSALFGSAPPKQADREEESKCSDIVFTDLCADGVDKTRVQQGVKIDHRYLSAQDGGKFDREIVLNRKFRFYFYIEKTGRDEDYYRTWLERLSTVLAPDNPLFIGGHTSVGSGWARFRDVTYLDYDFSNPSSLKAFLLRPGSEREFIEELMAKNGRPLPAGKGPVSGRNFVNIEYRATFKDAFLINDPEAAPADDDAEFNFLKIGDRFTVPGSSVKGVFRSRAAMIVRTMGLEEKRIDELFGDTDQKSRIYFSYAFAQDQEVREKRLDGVSIDRFTGGTVEAAKFDFKLLMNSTFSGSIIVDLSQEAGWRLALLYLVIRDIRDGDLPFGFGRTKGWGRVCSFEYRIAEKRVDKHNEKYVSNDTFNIEEIQGAYQQALPSGE